MPLERKIIPVQFGGLDQGQTEPKLVTDGLLACDNALFTRRGAISKRRGFKALSAPGGQFLAPFGDRFLAYGDGLQVHKGSTAVTDGFSSATLGTSGSAAAVLGLCDIFSESVSQIAPHYDFQQVNSALVGDVIVYTYCRRETTSTYSAGLYRLGITTINRYSGVVIDTLVGIIGLVAEQIPFITCELVGSDVWVVYADTGGVLKCRKVPSTGIIAAEQTISGSPVAVHQSISYPDGGAGAMAAFCAVSSTHGHMVYRAALTDDWYLTDIDFSASPPAATQKNYAAPATDNDSKCCGIFKWADGQSCCLWSHYDAGVPANRLYADVINNALTSQMAGAPHVLYSANEDPINSITGYADAANSGRIYFTRIYGVSDTSTRGLQWVDLDNSAGTAVIGTATRSERVGRVKISSRPWVDGYSKVHLLVQASAWNAYERGEGAQMGVHQGTVYLLRVDASDTENDGVIVGWSRHQEASKQQGPMVSVPWALSGSYLYQSVCLGAAITPPWWNVGATGNTQHGTVLRLEIDTERRKATTLSDGESTYFANGLPVYFDGQKICEMGPLHYPMGLSASVVASASSAFPIGTYGYVAVYEWTDGNGNLIRSAPSPVASVTTTATTDGVDVRIPYLADTRRGGCRIIVYRSGVNDANYRKLGHVDNDPSGGRVLWRDNGLSNATGELLYTVSGELDSVGPAGHRVACLHQQRYWYVPRDAEADTIRYSKRRAFGRVFEFNELLEHKITPDGGRIVAIAALDDKLVVFKQDGIYALAGDGADPTGSGSTLTDAFQVSSGIGCINRDSLVQTPEGICFLSRDGIYLLSKQLNLAPIGRRVKYQTDSVAIVAGCANPKRNVAVWATSSAKLLVYNWLFDQWSVWTPPAQTGCITAQGELYLVRSSDGVVWVTDDTKTDDEGTNIAFLVDTGWIPLNGLHGFGRIYKALMGAYYDGTDSGTPETLTAKILYDYDHAVIDTLTYLPHTKLAQKFGWSEYFGAASANNVDKTLLWELCGSRQKATAVRYQVSDNGDDKIDLIGLALEIGLKGSTYRAGESRR